MQTEKIDNTTVKKILIIKLRGIGDVVLSTVIFSSLSDYFPNAKIDFLTEKPGAEALSNISLLNEIIIFNRKSNWQRFKLFFNIRKRNYDLIVDLFSNPATAQITYFSNAKYRIGFPYSGRKYAYNIYGPEERSKYHSAQLHLELLKNAGIEITDNKLHFAMDTVSQNTADSWFSKLEDKLNIGIIPGGGWASKRCDPVKFAEIGDAIAKKYSANIILIWGPADKPEANEIQKLMKHKSYLAPSTSIREMGAFINNCDAVIANDSGPMHISTAIGTPALAIHGPTNPKLQGPFGTKHEFVNKTDLHCIVCNLLECPHQHECFIELPLKDVMDKFEILLAKNNIHLQ